MRQFPDFSLPPSLAAHEPPEARGRARDAVRMLVSRTTDDRIVHSRFRDLPRYLAAGDVMVVNTSATINGAFDAVHRAQAGNPERVMLHLSSLLPDGSWLIELRRLSASGTVPLLDARVGDRVYMRGGGLAILTAPYLRDQNFHGSDRTRLWRATLHVSGTMLDYAARYGAPIRYHYVPRSWPLSSYQNVYARVPGSVEMPSAGRPFTHSTLRRLKHKGVHIAHVVLHTGVSSLESDERPFPERFEVSARAAKAINEARARGGRVLAVGTTVVRAVETVATARGPVLPGRGWTDLVITPERGLHAVNALLTGFHAPGASHLLMLASFAGEDHLALAYRAAVERRYLWHEFGDVHLIL